MLYSFQHGGTLRAFAIETPQDWFDHLPLPLLVLLHPEGMTVEQFIATTRIQAFMTNAQFPTGTEPFVPPIEFLPDLLPNLDQRPKVAALFPVGLGRESDLGGGWKCGHMAHEARLFDVDDVAFVMACIERVQAQMAQQYFEIASVRPGPIFDASRRYAAGFSQGGQLCYKLAAERPGFFKAIAVHSALPAGWALNKDAMTQPAEAYGAASDDPPTSVLHIHGDFDGWVAWDGNSSDHRRFIGGYVDIMGPTPDAYWRADPPIDDPANGVFALWANPGLGWIAGPAVTAPVGGLLSPLASFDDFILGDATVRVLLVRGMGGGSIHEWANRTNYGFDALSVIWNFFLALP